MFKVNVNINLMLRVYLRLRDKVKVSVLWYIRDRLRIFHSNKGQILKNVLKKKQRYANI